MSTPPQNPPHVATPFLLPAPAGASAETHSQTLPETPNTDEITRAEGWTRPKQAQFLRVLASSHCVTEAARSVGMSRQSAYRLRNRLQGEPFDIAWAAAFRRQYDALAEAALGRAINGVEVPHFFQGELVHVSRRFDERLTVALLALRGQLDEVPASRHGEHLRFGPEDFEALVERVEEGDELWAD